MELSNLETSRRWISLYLRGLLRIITRQKGLQSNSGPMCSFVFVCWHCFCLLASRRSDRAKRWPAAEELQCSFVNSADRCKKLKSTNCSPSWNAPTASQWKLLFFEGFHINVIVHIQWELWRDPKMVLTTFCTYTHYDIKGSTALFQYSRCKGILTLFV